MTIMQPLSQSISTKVLLLDPHTINQIAAGEVVERPASVVKELVENALDAGASRVEIELEGHGSRLICVRDDGCGMSQEDARAALERHATSKIRSAIDLLSVSTMGFRGEAIPSIASVSRFRLSTAQEDGLRHVLSIEGGQRMDWAAEAGPRGTEVRAEDLFFNTPARLRFLKSGATELSACVEVVSKCALARPEVAFLLRHEGSVLLQTSGDADLLTALAEVWGREAVRALAMLDHFDGGSRVRGLVSPPHFTKPNRSYQWFFVNGRPVRAKGLMAAVDAAYRSLTPERRYPLIALMLDMDPAQLDVNVSPTKTEVKFAQERAVFEAVYGAIRSALLEQGMVPDAESLARANEAVRGASFQSSLGVCPEFTSGRFLELGIGVNPAQLSLEAQTPLGGLGGFAAAQVGSMAAPSLSPSDFLDGLVVVGQAMKTFILAENRRGLLIIDQHVAHERVLYEWLLSTRGQKPPETQALLVPETLHLDQRAAAVVIQHQEDLGRVGFEIEVFGGNSFLLRSAPAALKKRSPLGALREMIDELVEGYGGCVADAREGVFATCACKMAVKAGDSMTLPEMEKLIVDLAQTENPYLCPHGRPITIVLERGDLLRKFKRT